MKQPVLILITGPTASGKSALAVELALKLDTEIISADSRQIYKGIPIVTAVPSIEERKGVKHHFLEILELEDYYSAARFEEDSLNLLNELFLTKDFVIACGGSMLYTDVLQKGIDELPTIPDEIRTELTEKWNKEGDNWLLNQLALLDPEYFKKVDKKNLKRVFHAVEISICANIPYSKLIGKTRTERAFDIIKITLNGDRDYLFKRINRRVEQMVSAGLEEEAANVFPKRHLNSLNTVGLKEWFDCFEGKLDRKEVIARIQKNTRVYAKKQITWHKRDKDANFLDFQENVSINVNKVLALIEKNDSMLIS